MSSKKGKIEELAKAASHISGFDEILYGGLPEGRTTLIEGGPGTGKSIVALEFLYRSALAGQAGIFVALLQIQMLFVRILKGQAPKRYGHSRRPLRPSTISMWMLSANR